MKVFFDGHLHSKYARATSKNMDIENLSRFGKLKGLNLIGTGDFTHPLQLKDLKQKLEPIEGSGLFQYNGMHFMLTTEMATFYYQNKKSRRIHHVIFTSSFEVVDQIIDVLTKKGANTGIDGRMAIKIPSPELVETLMNISKNIMILPAHIFTPWYGVLGSITGFDTIEDCYQDQIKHIHALETGLSSDPAMNWRLSSLDKFCLISNSDSHSAWPWRLGRECNVFNLDKVTYSEITSTIKKKDKKKFLFTIEVDPAYGKYHWTGHRNCQVEMSPKEALKVDNVCSKCGKKLTIGVEQRVEELADRPEGFMPKNSIPFKKLIPLSELIKIVKGIKTLSSQTVWKEYNKLILEFDNEFNILIDVPRKDLEEVVDKKLIDLIMLNREGKIEIIPGYDGVYGEPVFGGKQEKKIIKKSEQKQLFEFKGSWSSSVMTSPSHGEDRRFKSGRTHNN